MSDYRSTTISQPADTAVVIGLPDDRQASSLLLYVQMKMELNNKEEEAGQ
jgi:hypothetical protein